MSLDVIYLAWNRREFAELSFALLLANTDWSLVDRLIVYEDGSRDGTREHLEEAIKQCPVTATLSYLGFGSPPATMNHHMAGTDAEFVAKVDSDIAMPPGWLNRAVEVMEANEGLELLGLAAGWTGVKDGEPGWEPSTHIGGVGLMRTSAFKRRVRIHSEGRQGFTQWQHQQNPVRGWIVPDVQALQLDLLPFEPWRSLSRRYIAEGWQREWPPYDDPTLWQWAFPVAA